MLYEVITAADAVSYETSQFEQGLLTYVQQHPARFASRGDATGALHERVLRGLDHLVGHGFDSGWTTRRDFRARRSRAVITSYSIHYTKLYEAAHQSDAQALLPAIEDTLGRDLAPTEVLADSLYGSDDNVEKAKEQGVA